jgi:fatty-acyl-CoA synthase
MDDRGHTKIEGRLKDMIIRGGENIYPREIEDLLFKHESVGEVAVVGLPDEWLGEVVGVFLRPAPGQAIHKDSLFADLRESLSPQKMPKHWFELEEFPLTGSGKIQKFVLRDEWGNGAFSELLNALPEGYLGVSGTRPASMAVDKLGCKDTILAAQ